MNGHNNNIYKQLLLFRYFIYSIIIIIYMINRLSTELIESESVHLAFKNISYSISLKQ